MRLPCDEQLPQLPLLLLCDELGGNRRAIGAARPSFYHWHWWHKTFLLRQ